MTVKNDDCTGMTVASSHNELHGEAKQERNETECTTGTLTQVTTISVLHQPDIVSKRAVRAAKQGTCSSHQVTESIIQNKTEKKSNLGNRLLAQATRNGQLLLLVQEDHVILQHCIVAHMGGPLRHHLCNSKCASDGLPRKEQ